ncbi:unnamed protein product [Allacma fusca]|uniref:Uncharacterized protein n=1 Tax=Allacma fusca TaxID=39272 RepID=A0A8J2PGZ9_9HEXA|nr:unnamed protein product [Allacma fusca]
MLKMRTRPGSTWTTSPTIFARTSSQIKSIHAVRIFASIKTTRSDFRLNQDDPVHGPRIICRKGLPKLPMENTIFLKPLNGNGQRISPRQLELQRSIYVRICDQLACHARDPLRGVTMHEFLDSLNLTMVDYQLAIRSFLSETTLFLKRTTGSAYVNSYNKRLKDMWDGHVNVQPVQDSYATAAYITNAPTHPLLLPLVDSSIHEAEGTLDQEMRRLISQDLAPRIQDTIPVGDYEAIHLVLGLPLASSSVATISLPSHIPEDQARRFLPKATIEARRLACQQPDSDDTGDIFYPNASSSVADSMGRLHNFTTGRFITPSAVLTDTILTWSSLPG